MTPEGRVTKQVIRALEAIRARGEPVWWVKLHGGPMQQAGLPDVLVVYCGLVFFIEIKAPAGRVSKLQEFVFDKIRRAGGIVEVVCGLKDMELALGKMRALGRERGPSI
jgi:fumarate reductase subunit D